jgi:hypothetical protein
MEEVTQPPHQQANNGGGSFAMVSIFHFLKTFKKAILTSLVFI